MWSLFLPIWLLPFMLSFQAEERPTVQAILFYSPTCPYCHTVISELLIPMQEQYGDQLQIIGVDTSHPIGNELFHRTLDWLESPEERQAVPFLIIGSTVLVGGGEIMSDFTLLVEDGIRAGGIGWPAIPDLELVIPDLPPSAAPESEIEEAEPASTTVVVEPYETSPEGVSTTADTVNSEPKSDFKNSRQPAAIVPTEASPAQGLEANNGLISSQQMVEPPADPVGFGLAAAVMFGMLMALIVSGWFIVRRNTNTAAISDSTIGLSWLVPVLALLGLGTALYLSYVETAQVEAVCGPIGECNIVQSSSYAKLYGVPVAVLGALSYMAIILLWAGQKYLPVRYSVLILTVLLGTTILGTGFSIYLTALELFVIKAICAWCLSSAIVMTLLMMLVAKKVNIGSFRMETAAPT